MSDISSTPRPTSGTAEGPVWQQVLRHDVASSFVVFLVALPLCMGIAQASGVPVAAGIITGIVGGIIVGLIAGAPLQVSGPAAGLTVLVYGVVQEHGYAALGMIVLLAGMIQVVAGLLKAGQWFRAVSPAVIRGMLSGIGVLIVGSQFHLMVDERPRSDGVSNLLTIPESIYKAFRVPELAPAEARDVRTGFLHRFSELHEKQEEIHELVVERVSVHPTPENALIEQLGLVPLVERQAAVLDDVKRQAEAARDSSIATDGTAASRRCVVALDQAIASGESALASLETRDLSSVRSTQAQAVAALTNLGSSLKKHDWAAMLGVLTIFTIIVWQSLTPKSWRIIPGPLLAVLLTTAFAFTLNLPVLYVEVPDNLLDGMHFPSMVVLQDVSFGTIFIAAIVMAAVASAETLLCAAAVDKMHTGPRTKFDRELAAQGVGNMISGFLGGLPMTGVIVRSAANVQAGARTRWSAILHGCWLLLFVVALGSLLRYVPTSVLAGILVYTGYKLIDIKALKELRAYGWSEVGIFLATVVGIVVLDLLSGVLIGIGLSGLKLLVKFSRLKTEFTENATGQGATLTLEGAATFLRLPKLAGALESVPPGTSVHIDLGGLTYLDHGCMELIASWTRQHQATGGEVVIDWDSLRADVRHLVTPAQQLRETIDAARLRASPERLAN